MLKPDENKFWRWTSTGMTVAGLFVCFWAFDLTVWQLIGIELIVVGSQVAIPRTNPPWE